MFLQKKKQVSTLLTSVKKYCERLKRFMEVNSNRLEFVPIGSKKDTPSGAGGTQVRCDFCKKQNPSTWISQSQSWSSFFKSKMDQRKNIACLLPWRLKWFEMEHTMSIKNSIKDLSTEHWMPSKAKKSLTNTKQYWRDNWLVQQQTSYRDVNSNTHLMPRFRSCWEKNSSPSCSKPWRHRVMERTGFGRI